MKSGLVSKIILAVLCVATVVAMADTKPNPYETIIKRNPFGLKDPPPPPDPNAPPPPPPPAPMPTVTLTGIATINGNKPKALLEIVEPGGKSQPKRETLFEGDRVDTVEVLSIDPLKSIVRLKIGETETNITFPKPGEMAKTAPPGPGVLPAAPNPTFRPPGFPGTPGAATPGAFNPSASTTPGAASGSSSVLVFGSGGASPTAAGARSGVSTFGATPTTPTAGAIPSAGVTAGAASVMGAAGLRSIPTRPIRTDQGGTGSAAPSRPMTTEEHALKMELDRVANQGRGGPPLPPTVLTPLLNQPVSK